MLMECVRKAAGDPLLPIMPVAMFQCVLANMLTSKRRDIS